MTNAKALEFVLNTYKADMPTDVAEKLEHMYSKTVEKNSTMTKAQKEKAEQNEVYKASILSAFDGSGHTCTEVRTFVSDLHEASTSQVSYLLNSLVKEGKLSKSTEKGKSIFRKV